MYKDLHALQKQMTLHSVLTCSLHIVGLRTQANVIVQKRISNVTYIKIFRKTI